MRTAPSRSFKVCLYGSSVEERIDFRKREIVSRVSERDDWREKSFEKLLQKRRLILCLSWTESKQKEADEALIKALQSEVDALREIRDVRGKTKGKHCNRPSQTVVLSIYCIFSLQTSCWMTTLLRSLLSATEWRDRMHLMRKTK